MSFLHIADNFIRTFAFYHPKKLIVCCTNSLFIVANYEKNCLLFVKKIPEEALSLSFSPDGQMVAGVSEHGYVYRFNFNLGLCIDKHCFSLLDVIVTVANDYSFVIIFCHSSVANIFYINKNGIIIQHYKIRDIRISQLTVLKDKWFVVVDKHLEEWTMPELTRCKINPLLYYDWLYYLPEKNLGLLYKDTDRYFTYRDGNIVEITNENSNHFQSKYKIYEEGLVTIKEQDYYWNGQKKHEATRYISFPLEQLDNYQPILQLTNGNKLIHFVHLATMKKIQIIKCSINRFVIHKHKVFYYYERFFVYCLQSKSVVEFADSENINFDEMCVSDDLSTFAVITWDHEVWVWNVNDGSIRKKFNVNLEGHRIGFPDRVAPLDISPSGQFITPDIYQENLCVYNTYSGKSTVFNNHFGEHEYSHDVSDTHISFGKKGFLTNRGTWKTIDPNLFIQPKTEEENIRYFHKKMYGTFTGQVFFFYAVFSSPKEDWQYILLYENGLLRLVDTISKQEIMHCPIQLSLNLHLKMSSNGKFLAIMNEKLLRVIEVQSGQQAWEKSITVHKYFRIDKNTFDIYHVENNGQCVYFASKNTPEVLLVSKDAVDYQLVLPQGEYISYKNKEHSFSTDAKNYICWPQNGFIEKPNTKDFINNNFEEKDWIYTKKCDFPYGKYLKEEMKESIARDIAKIKWKKSIEEAFCCCKEKNFMGAFIHYKSAIEQGNEEPETYHCTGRMALLIKNTTQAHKYLQKAISRYKKYLEATPKNYRDIWGIARKKDILFWIASCYALLEQKNLALDYLQKSVVACSDNAQRFFKKEDFEKYWCDNDFIKLTNNMK